MTTDTTRGTKTRYVFAGTAAQGKVPTTKVCPRCGQVLFEDMDVCYGCLYDFSRDRSRSASMPPGRLPSRMPVRVASDDPLGVIELDEIDDEVVSGTPEEDVPQEVVPEAKVAASAPRHRREPSDGADDTIDFSSLDLTTVAAPLPQEERRLVIVVSSADMQVRVPIPKEGLSVGRDEASDIVLRSRLVSRSHLRLTPCDGGVMAEDCGATNPATIEGAPLAGSMLVERGSTIDVCGTSLSVA